MFKYYFLIALGIGLAAAAQAQDSDKIARKLEKQREENWPPERIHGRTTLGYALQQTFKRHSEYCGFGLSNSKRDYVPADINRFLGKRHLRTRVEIADIRGGGLLYYVFQDKERGLSFDQIAYSPTKILRINSVPGQFVVNPDENFDAFILTKNCSGYLKAALDAGIEPPYVAFKKALETDERRESNVVALSGAFLSPLKPILDSGNAQTTEALMQLWKFYIDNPAYVNNAYYLREFEGVMIKHVSQAQDNFKIDAELGINLNGLLPARLKTSFGIGKTTSSVFSGTDWQTIVFADFEGAYAKEKLFAPLPSPAAISAYFAQLKPICEKSRDYPLMTEGLEYKHFLTVAGIPDFMTSNFWEIEQVGNGVYDGRPSLIAEPYRNETDGSFGCRFTVSGKPLSSNFSGPLTERPGKLLASYVIRSRVPVGGEYIRLIINEEIQTSAHPIASLAGGEFDLTKKEDRKFAFQWTCDIEVEDSENPIDFNALPYIDNLVVRRSDKTLNVRLAKIQPDPHRRHFHLTLETVDTYPLDQVDDHNMINYNLSMDVHLLSQRAGTHSIRPVRGTLAFPTIKAVEAMPVMTPTGSAPAQSDGG